MLIKYTLPVIGKTEVPLYGETIDVYSFLEEHRQIFRLRNLNQLGVISEVIHTARHPKFEYIFLQLYLFDEIKDLKGVYPLNKNIYETITGTELLKIWALLLSIGHMPCTFPVEKAILRILFEDKKVKDNLLNSINSKEIRQYSEKIIEEQNIYSFYHVLSFIKLFKYCHGREQIAFSKRCASLLSLYCFDSKKASLNQLKELFGKIRRFSYVMLDSYYTSGKNILNLEDLKNFSGVMPNEHLQALINCMDSYLLQQIYKTRECVIAEILLYQAIYQRLKKHKCPVALISNYLYANHDTDIYQTYAEFKKSLRLEGCDFYSLLNISTNRTNIFDQENEIDSIISRFVSRKNKFKNVLFNVDRPPHSLKSSITVFINNDFEFKRRGLLPSLVREALAESFKNESVKYNPLLKAVELKSSPRFNLFLKKQVNEQNFKNIFKAIFKAIFSDSVVQLKVSAKEDMKSLSFPECFYDKYPYLHKEALDVTTTKNRELLELSKMASKLIAKDDRARLIISTNNVELQRKPTKRLGFIIGEFDGAILEVNKKKLTLYILEAKKNTVNYSYARKQLSRIKRYLKPQYRKEGLARIQRIETGGKSAFLRIKLS